MGSGNYTIMLDPDYKELLGVLAPTEHNAPARGSWKKRGEDRAWSPSRGGAAAGAKDPRPRRIRCWSDDFERP